LQRPRQRVPRYGWAMRARSPEPEMSHDRLDDLGLLDEGDEQVALFANDYRSATSRRAAELRASHAPRRFSR